MKFRRDRAGLGEGFALPLMNDEGPQRTEYNLQTMSAPYHVQCNTAILYSLSLHRQPSSLQIGEQALRGAAYHQLGNSRPCSSDQHVLQWSRTATCASHFSKEKSYNPCCTGYDYPKVIERTTRGEMIDRDTILHTRSTAFAVAHTVSTH